MFVLQDVTKSQIDALHDELDKSGTGSIELSKDGSYLVSERGVIASAVFDAAAGTLAVTIEHKPMLIPESVIEHGLIEAIAKLPAVPAA